MDKDLKYCIAKFIKYINDELNLNTPFSVKLTASRDDDFKTYAFYDKTQNLIKVYVKGRGMADVLRSIAHEFVHHKQNEFNLLNKPHPDVGGEIEDQANSVAGQLVKKFGYRYPDLLIYSKKF